MGRHTTSFPKHRVQVVECDQRGNVCSGGRPGLVLRRSTKEEAMSSESTQSESLSRYAPHVPSEKPLDRLVEQKRLQHVDAAKSLESVYSHIPSERHHPDPPGPRPDTPHRQRPYSCFRDCDRTELSATGPRVSIAATATHLHAMTPAAALLIHVVPDLALSFITCA